MGLAAALLVSGCGVPGTPWNTKPPCPSFSVAVAWTSETSRPSRIQMFDASGAAIGESAIDVQGITNSDQTPGHANGKIVLASSGNTVHDEANFMTFDPETCLATRARQEGINPLNVAPFDDGYLAFGWTNGVAQLRHILPDGRLAAQYRLNDWVGLTALTVTDSAVYAIANYGDRREAILVMLDRITLREMKRVQLPQIRSEDGPRYSALIGDTLYFPADRNGDNAATDSALGTVNLKTFTTGTLDLGIASPYIVRAFDGSLYVAHTSMQATGSQISIVNVSTGKVSHLDVGTRISAMDVNGGGLAVVGYLDPDLRRASLKLYRRSDLALQTDVELKSPAAPGSDEYYYPANVFVP